MDRLLTGRLRLKRRRAFIESYTFPSALTDKLRERFGDERTVALALDGLRSWYLACLCANGELLGMPSRTVDVAWHEMILVTREYHAFCDRAFGHYLHHSPEAVVSVPMEDMLASTLDVVEKHSATPAVAGVPLLFAVDREAGIEDGFVWGGEDVARMRERRVRSGTRPRNGWSGRDGSTGWAYMGFGGGDGGGGGAGDGGGGGCGGGG